MKVVELRRHAERDSSEDLTPRGLAQCVAAKKSLGFPYDAYVVSPAKRARLTMEALGGRAATVEPRIAPRPRPPFAPYDTRHMELMEGGMDSVTAWFAILEAGRALKEIGTTVAAAVRDIAATLPENGRALAVSHGGTIEPFAVVALNSAYETIFGTRELGYCEGIEAYLDGGTIVRIDVVRLPLENVL